MLLTWVCEIVSQYSSSTSLSANNRNDHSPYPSGGSLHANAVIFAFVGNGIFKSNDNGLTWEQKIGVLFGFDAICKSGNKIIASSSNYTLESTDHGETWNYITYLDGAIIFSYYVMGDTIFAGGQTKIYRSLDNGNTFTTINLNLGFSIVNIFDFEYANSTLYAATSHDGVYKSTDGGENWLMVNNNGVLANSYFARVNLQPGNK